MHSVAEKPGWPQSLIEGNHGRSSGRHVEQVQKRLHEIVRLHRTTGDTYDGNLRLRLPFPSQVIWKPHTSCRVAFHGVNAAIGSAGSCRHHRPSAGSETIDPVTGSNWLTGLRIGAEGGPITLLLIMFIRDRAFDDQNEIFLIPLSGLVEGSQEVVAIGQGKEGVV